MIDLADIEAARDRIDAHVRRTPVLAVDQVKSPLANAKITLKLECLQVTGSFKARGAMNRFLGVAEAGRPSGLVTASGGNHGLAIARTGFVCGVPATIFVPTDVSAEKVAKMQAWGADVHVVDGDWNDAQSAALGTVTGSGATYIHPFADPLIVAGQGTVALELLQDLPDLDAVVIAIGGGGLISGMGTALKARRPDVRVIGVEPDGSPTLKASLDAGRVVELERLTTRVATMACRRTEDSVFERVRDVTDDIVLVSDEDMAAASRWLWFEMGIAADLSGAASIAALRKHGDQIASGGHVCALVCGAGPEGTLAAKA